MCAHAARYGVNERARTFCVAGGSWGGGGGLFWFSVGAPIHSSSDHVSCCIMLNEVKRKDFLKTGVPIMIIVWLELKSSHFVNGWSPCRR